MGGSDRLTSGRAAHSVGRECRTLTYYARFNFRCKSKAKLLEVNPNPGRRREGKPNLMAGFAGQRYADLLRQILEAAQARMASRELLVGLRPSAGIR